MSYGSGRSSYLLRRDMARDEKKLKSAISSAQAQEESAEAGSTYGSAAGSLAGGIGVPLAATALANFWNPIGWLAGAAGAVIGAGAGSYIGSKAGQKIAGGPGSVDYQGKFHQQEKQDASKVIAESIKRRKEGDVIGAGTSAVTAGTMLGVDKAFAVGADDALKTVTEKGANIALDTTKASAYDKFLEGINKTSLQIKGGLKNVVESEIPDLKTIMGQYGKEGSKLGDQYWLDYYTKELAKRTVKEK